MTDLLTELIDTIWARLAPTSFKTAHSQCLRNAEHEILLVGTIHERHLTSAGYTLADLANVVANYEPDCVLIEARAQDLAAGLLNLAPVEMAQLALLARRRNIRVQGFDWWSEEAAAARAEAKRPLGMGGIGRLKEIFTRLQDSLNQGRRVATFVGYSHFRALARRLKAAGYSTVSLTSAERRQLFRDVGGPPELLPEMRPSLEASLEHCRRILASYPKNNAWSHRLQRKTKSLQRLRNRLDDAGVKPDPGKIGRTTPRR